MYILETGVLSIKDLSKNSNFNHIIFKEFAPSLKNCTTSGSPLRKVWEPLHYDEHDNDDSKVWGSRHHHRQQWSAESRRGTKVDIVEKCLLKGYLIRISFSVTNANGKRNVPLG